jgi:hypothetical protein
MRWRCGCGRVLSVFPTRGRVVASTTAGGGGRGSGMDLPTAAGADFIALAKPPRRRGVAAEGRELNSTSSL